MNYINRWSASSIWVATMIGAWFTLVPRTLSASNWVVATVTGLVILFGAATLWEANRPTPSFGQARAEEEAASASASRRR
jgi:hypothetical protein